MASGKIRIVMNSPGIRELLKSSEVRRDLEQRAAGIEGRARSNSASGAEFEVKTSISPTRVRVSVWTVNKKARIAEATDRALSKALGGVGLVAYTNKAGQTRMVTQAQADNWGSRKGK